LIRFPVIDNDIILDNLEKQIRSGPLVNVDMLIGVTADEALYFAGDHILHHYLPKKYRTNPPSRRTSQSWTKSPEHEQPRGFSYFKKNKYIRNYLKSNYPDHLCYYEDIQERYMPKTIDEHNATEIAQLYTNLLRLFSLIS
jgi:hypothetical protein